MLGRFLMGATLLTSLGGMPLVADTCTSGDKDGDGYTDVQYGGDDCNDADGTIHPNAIEQCDGKDNNCDGAIDDGTFYTDSDGDGFGTTPTTCSVSLVASNVSPARGDCNDADAVVYPGASDMTGDGIDQDCGGSDGEQPSVNTKSAQYTTIQSALSYAKSGQTVWIGPGTYYEYNLQVPAGVSLRSTHGRTQTIIDGNDYGGLVKFLATSAYTGYYSGIDGFTLVNGYASRGGAVYVELGGKVNISNCEITSNTATEYGGGLYTPNGGSTNLSYINVDNSLIHDNTAASGGGFAITGSYSGYWSVMMFTNSLVYFNTASVNGSGGYLAMGWAGFDNSVIDNNRLYTWDCNEIWLHNSSLSSGGLYMQISFEQSEYCRPWVYGSYSNAYNWTFYNEYPDSPNSEMGEFWPQSTTQLDPMYADELYHLAPDSRLIDSGDPDTKYNDIDGSRSDIGAYGGPNGNW